MGISLDGDRSANDLHRLYANGRSSYDEALHAIELLRRDEYHDIYAGLLATIDIRSNPIAVYRALAELEPPHLDFLLPHGTWDTPPPGSGQGRYGDWLGQVFDQWTQDGRRVPIRIFNSIIATSRGGASGTESLGLEPSDVLVIETDGTIEQADSIKVAFDGAPATGLDIFRHPLDEAAAHRAIRARQMGLEGLSATCRECLVVTSCGGGLYAHRYRTGSGFKNPSVYCTDLKQIITHVQASEAGRYRRKHSITKAHFDAIAAGYGDAAAISYLTAPQRSIRRQRLGDLHRQVATDASGMFTTGWDLLVRLDKSSPTVVGGVLAHPYVRAWAERCLWNPDATLMDADHVAAIAAAAAIRSGAMAELEVPVTGGYVNLPTLGRLHIGDDATAKLAARGEGVFEVRATAGAWRIDSTAAQPHEDWQPVRELRAGDLAVSLEDTDPYRDCYQLQVTGRLSADEAAAWQVQFAEAWRLIEMGYPQYAPGIAAGLSVLMPLANDVSGRTISAATGQAFGAVAIALPASGADLARQIIHEFQHVKLSALTDLFVFYDQQDKRVFPTLWRDDPRPLGALLQGTYAHLAIADYWRRQRDLATGPDAIAAVEQFARWRLATMQAIETLRGSGTLTTLGTRFVEGMRATVGPWLGEQVPAGVAAAAVRWAVERQAAADARRDARSADGAQGGPD